MKLTVVLHDLNTFNNVKIHHNFSNVNVKFQGQEKFVDISGGGEGGGPFFLMTVLLDIIVCVCVCACVEIFSGLHGSKMGPGDAKDDCYFRVSF